MIDYTKFWWLKFFENGRDQERYRCSNYWESSGNSPKSFYLQNIPSQLRGVFFAI